LLPPGRKIIIWQVWLQVHTYFINHENSW
jgi:hypothetical protein